MLKVDGYDSFLEGNNNPIYPHVAVGWTENFFFREFPLEHLLVLWDSLFAEDPDFTLVDYICIAMLLRIRWERLCPISHVLFFACSR